MSVSEIISVEPATGAVFWRAPISDVNAEVEIARESWVSWAAQNRYKSTVFVGSRRSAAPLR